MTTLAQALLDLAAFLELSADDVVDPDSVVAAMEDAAATLQRATAEERNALRTAAKALAKETTDPARRKFYRGFMDAIGLDED